MNFATTENAIETMRRLHRKQVEAITKYVQQQVVCINFSLSICVTYVTLHFSDTYLVYRLEPLEDGACMNFFIRQSTAAILRRYCNTWKYEDKVFECMNFFSL